ncbi:MAG: hypothetical protein V4734_07925, partial [Terriglobus sp.]
MGETHRTQQGLLSHISVGAITGGMRLCDEIWVLHHMGFVRSLSLIAAAVVLAAGTVSMPAQQSPPPVVAPPPAMWVPDFGEVMASNASHTSFTFDRNMLSAADQFFANGDPATQRVVAGLNSITVRTYR